MEQYIDLIRERIIRAFQREGVEGNQTNQYEILLNNGQVIDGGLVRHTDATFTVQTSRAPDGTERREIEIPYLAVSGIKYYWSRE